MGHPLADPNNTGPLNCWDRGGIAHGTGGGSAGQSGGGRWRWLEHDGVAADWFEVNEGSEEGTPGLSTAAFAANGKLAAVARAGGRGGWCLGRGAARGLAEARGGERIPVAGASGKLPHGTVGSKMSRQQLNDEVHMGSARSGSWWLGCHIMEHTWSA
jgi:hypothetical protein